ncbi:MAG: dienelactone hydrolase family protein [Burkholderiales bacterium]
MTALLPAIELTTGHNPVGSVIWMHGLGADGTDFVPVIKELGLPESLPLRFIFPHAPMRAVTINSGSVMRAWFDILEISNVERKVDETGIRESQRAIEAFIEREISRGIEAKRIVLAGFSQGGAIALQAGLRHSQALAGILALSTYLPLASKLEAEASSANRSIPIFMAHGEQDTMIPISIAEHSYQELSRQGHKVEWREYPMAHSVSTEEIMDIGAWLKRRFQ